MKKFTDYLVEKNIIKKEEMDKIIISSSQSGIPILEYIIKEGYISEDNLLMLISEYLSIPPIKVKNLNINKEVLNLIPPNIASNFNVLPIAKIGKTITLAMSDPLNIAIIDDIKAITNCEINPVVATFSEIREAISKNYGSLTVESFSLEEIIKDKETNLEVIKEEREEILQDVILKSLEEAPVIKFTDYILNRAINESASDILIEPLENVSRIRFRIDGVLHQIETFQKKNHPYIVSRLKVMANLNIAEFRLPQEGRFRKKILNKEVDFRISILPSSLGEKVALRVLDKTTTILDINKLGFEEDVLKKIKEDSLKPHGLILVCGPTGCGKTTTLYSILSYIYTPQKNIITVEDPIEYQLKGINQVNVNPLINLTFARILRSILRQDPNVIMIGEIRDAETADIAIKASLTGHLVLSTIHTTTAAGSVSRLLNMQIEPFLLASSLIGVLAQRLVRKLCPKCKEEFKISKNIKEKYLLETDTIFKPKGCNFCQNTGYKGRIAICEYLQVTDKLKNLINKSAPEPVIKKEARLSGMKTIREDGLLKIKNGITSLEEVLKVSSADEPLI